MATHAPVHPHPAASRPEQRAEGRASAAVVPRPLIVTLGIAALWMALVMGLQYAGEHAFGLETLDAWAYAIGIVSYVYLFVGFIVGLIYMVRKAEV